MLRGFGSDYNDLVRSTGIEATKQKRKRRIFKGKRAKKARFFNSPRPLPVGKIDFLTSMKKSPFWTSKLFAENLLTFSDSSAIIKPQQGRNL